MLRRRTLLAGALAVVMAPAVVAADEPPTTVTVERVDARPTFGIGMIIGTTVGLATKIYVEPRHAIDISIGSYNFKPGISGQADWVWHAAEVLRSRSLVMPLYLGGGIRTSHWEHDDHMHTDLALRAPVGLAAQLTSAPLDFFLEGGLDVNLLSGGGQHRRAALTAAIGSRYFF